MAARGFKRVTSEHQFHARKSTTTRQNGFSVLHEVEFEFRVWRISDVVFGRMMMPSDPADQ